MSFQSDFYTSVSNMYRILWAIVFMMHPNSIKSQERLHVVKTDSLKYKTFEQLNTLSDKAFQNNNTTLLGKYRDYHLKKAKKEHNNLETARAYYSFIGWEDIEQDLKYSDSIIGITKNSDYKSYPTTGYLIKARLYYFNSDFNKALDNYIIANEWADI
uniref:hypothetical protein n=1 Tax=Yeosuana sp. TaxID=2529388 RepID=UPI004054DFA6